MSTASGTKARNECDAARLISSHQAGVWRYLRALGCDASLADDLTQETFLTVLRKPIRHYNDTATGTYLRKVAYHRFVTHQRRNGRCVSTVELASVEMDFNAWAKDDNGEALLEALRDCLKHLTDRARHAIELRFRLNRSRNQIAQALRVGPHGAKNILQRAKQQLRVCIERKLS